MVIIIISVKWNSLPGAWAWRDLTQTGRAEVLASSVLSLLDLKWVHVFCGREVLAALLHDLERSHLAD
jgi:hypothetical protein